jgi:hypothetical protein
MRPFVKLLRPQIDDGQTTVSVALDFNARINILDITVPDIAAVTLTVAFTTDYGTMASKSAIAENGNTKLDPSDFDAGLQWLVLSKEHTMVLTLSGDPTTDALIPIVLYGEEY